MLDLRVMPRSAGQLGVIGQQRQRVLALLIVAVAAATAGAAVAANAPSSPDATFGTAGYLFTLPGSNPHLTADIAAARKWFGVIDVIGHQNVAIPGSLSTVDLRAQDPAGPFGHPMLRLDAGHYPTGPGQVAVTAEVAAIYRLKLGGSWHERGHARRVVGLVENPQNLQDNFALVAPSRPASARSPSPGIAPTPTRLHHRSRSRASWPPWRGCCCLARWPSAARSHP